MLLSFYYYQFAKKFLITFRQNKMPYTIYWEKILDGEMGNSLIATYLENSKPCMIARIGSVEMQAINEIYNVKYHLKKEFSDIKLHTLYTNAGFFPLDYELVSKFEEVYRNACSNVDIMAHLHNRDEDFWIKHFSKGTQHVALTALEPYYWERPWSRVLEGKTILVISPFSETVEKQYQVRKQLFNNKEILPEFKLKTFTAVQSIGDNTGGFSDWFHALQYMQDSISSIEFDIAIIGCGAYSFPLASFCKEMGKKAIVLGGATQILFGIKGKRWEQIDKISSLFNPYWNYPADNERPQNYEKVEGGCYW